MAESHRSNKGNTGTPRTTEERQAKLERQRSKRLLPSVTSTRNTNSARRPTAFERTSSSGSSKSSSGSSLGLAFDAPGPGRRNRLCYPEVDAPGKPLKSIELRPNERLVFLAGGVQAPVDWRKEIAQKLEHFPGLPNLALVRPELPKGNLFEELINWEIDHFGKSVILVYWFHKYTVCPMTLVEFGQWAVPYAARPSRPYKVIIGADPEYAKVREVKCYCEGKYIVHDNLDDLAKATAQALRSM